MDSIVSAVIESFKQRSEFGQKKYGTNLDRTDLKFFDWVQHMQEELMDATLYLEKMKTESVAYKERLEAKMYVPSYYRLSIDSVNEMISGWGDNHQTTWYDLMAIDYAYHHKDADYDGGLSFIDRIHKKIGTRHPFWNLADLKNRAASLEEYHRIISALFTEQRDIDYYGV